MTVAKFWRLYHGIAVLVWMAMIPVAFVTHLASSVPFVTFLSLWALVATEGGAWQASRAEVASVEVQSVTTETVTVTDQEAPSPE